MKQNNKQSKIENLPNMDSAEAETNEQGDKTSVWLHVVTISDRQDDDNQQSCSKDLVKGQAGSANLSLLMLHDKDNYVFN